LSHRADRAPAQQHAVELVLVDRAGRQVVDPRGGRGGCISAPVEEHEIEVRLFDRTAIVVVAEQTIQHDAPELHNIPVHKAASF
jgi:hypothetical protein